MAAVRSSSSGEQSAISRETMAIFRDTMAALQAEWDSRYQPQPPSNVDEHRARQIRRALQAALDDAMTECTLEGTLVPPLPDRQLVERGFDLGQVGRRRRATPQSRAELQALAEDWSALRGPQVEVAEGLCQRCALPLQPDDDDDDDLRCHCGPAADEVCERCFLFHRHCRCPVDATGAYTVIETDSERQASCNARLASFVRHRDMLTAATNAYPLCHEDAPPPTGVETVIPPVPADAQRVTFGWRLRAGLWSFAYRLVGRSQEPVLTPEQQRVADAFLRHVGQEISRSCSDAFCREQRLGERDEFAYAECPYHCAMAVAQTNPEGVAPPHAH